MITATWTDTVVAVSTAAGTIGILGALIFAALQTRALRHQLFLSNAQNERAISLEQAALDIQLMERIIEVDHVFIEHPDLREYFFEGTKTPATDPDRARVLAVADLIMDVADSVASVRRHGHMLDEDYEAWRNALHNYFTQSPAMRDLWPEIGHYYGPGTSDVLFETADAPPSSEARPESEDGRPVEAGR